MGLRARGSRVGEGKPSESPRTFRTLRNSLLSLELAGPPVSPGLAFVSSVSARPPDRFSIPRSFFPADPQDIPTVVSSPSLACPRSAGPPPQSCTPLVFPSSRTQPLGPLRWAAGRLGWNPGRESSGLGGGRSSPRLQKGLRVPSAGPRHEGLCREWGFGISRLRVLRASGPQVVAGAFAASAARRSPCGSRGALRVAGRLEICPGGGSASTAPFLKTPSAWQEPRVWLPLCRARWRGRERRGQCLHLLTKGSRSSSPPERPAALRPPSRHLVALASRAASPCGCAACLWLLAAGGTEQHQAVASGLPAVL